LFEVLFFFIKSGFVDSSEPLEDAVARETFEESGVVVDKSTIEYKISQPWSFQQNNNLMVGFFVQAETEEIKVDDKEMEDVKWFDRNQILEILENKSNVTIPPKIATANYLINLWVQSK
jgi:NAD+ diphosphatase